MYKRQGVRQHPFHYAKKAGKSEVMKHMDKVFNSAVAVIATAFTFLFGDWDIACLLYTSRCV